MVEKVACSTISASAASMVRMLDVAADGSRPWFYSDDGEKKKKFISKHYVYYISLYDAEFFCWELCKQEHMKNEKQAQEEKKTTGMHWSTVSCYTVKYLSRSRK
jgi:hypothetical protein